MKEKLTDFIRTLFSAGITLTGILSLLLLLAWIILLFIGGETAAAAEGFIHSQILPVMYFVVIALAFLGILYVYLKGIWTFRFDVKGGKKSEERYHIDK